MLMFRCEVCGLTHQPAVVVGHGIARGCASCGGETFTPADCPTADEKTWWPYPATLLIGPGHETSGGGVYFVAGDRDEAAGVSLDFTWDMDSVVGEEERVTFPGDEALETLLIVLACKLSCVQVVAADDIPEDALLFDPWVRPIKACEASEREAERLGLGSDAPLAKAARMALAWLYREKADG